MMGDSRARPDVPSGNASRAPDDSDPAIAYLPYRTRLGASLAGRPVDDLLWPVGRPRRLDGAKVGDLESQDHCIMHPVTAAHFLPNLGSPAQFSLVMGEPRHIHAKHFHLLRVTWRRFFRVLTFNEDLIARIPNGIFMPYGTTWIRNWRKLETSKSANCSLIASGRRKSEGHRLRHSVVDWIRETGQDVDIVGRGYVPFDEKTEGLAPYRYTVVIENGREKNYFTEKLLDAVFCRCVPIYWGCPNIERFCDPSPMIICESEVEIREALANVSEADYFARLPALTALAEQLAAYADLETRSAEAIRDAIGNVRPRPPDSALP